MRRRHLTIRTLLVTLLAATFAACQDPVEPPTTENETAIESSAGDSLQAEAMGFWRRPPIFARPFTVMTRNLYLGGDTGPVFGADFSNPLEVVQVSATVWAQVVNSGIPERMAAIADEIRRDRPDIVSIQEAFQFLELDLSSGTPTPVQSIDLLAILEVELAARGLDYEVVRVRSNTNATLPIDVDLSTGQVTRAVNFTDRIAVLAASHVDVEEVVDANYAATFPLAPGVELKRGWIRVTTEHRGVRYHVVSTHLEVQALGPIHNAQGAELRTSVADGLDGVVVIAGDLNSDAAGSPGEPDWTPTYGDLIDAGFQDTWHSAGRFRRGRGYTCCQEADLRNPISVLDRRIDFVLIRGDGLKTRENGLPGWVRTELIGHRSWDRTPSGLWPSDHAGLVTELKVPRGLGKKPNRHR